MQESCRPLIYNWRLETTVTNFVSHPKWKDRDSRISPHLSCSMNTRHQRHFRVESLATPSRSLLALSSFSCLPPSLPPSLTHSHTHTLSYHIFEAPFLISFLPTSNPILWWSINSSQRQQQQQPTCIIVMQRSNSLTGEGRTRGKWSRWASWDNPNKQTLRQTTHHLKRYKLSVSAGCDVWLCSQNGVKTHEIIKPDTRLSY